MLNAELDRRLSALPHPERILAALDGKLRERGLLFGDQPIPTFLGPHFVAAAPFDRWTADTEALFALIERVAALILTRPDLCRWLGFSDAQVDLFRIDPGYARTVVVARPDAVCQNGQAHFVEINCDSPAMMTFADELEDLFFELLPLADLGGRITPHRRTAALRTALLECHREFGGSGDPVIAIIDWPGEKTAHELVKTAALFSALGTEAFVAGPSELSYADGKLRASGRTVDLVYRRILCGDFITRAAELKPLADAYRDGKVCMANPLRSFLVGTKALLALLHDPDRLELSPAERAVVDRSVPPTFFLSPSETLPRDRWVLKKAESYGGKDVILGSLVDEVAWRAGIASVREREWIKQRLEEIPTLSLPVLRDGRLLRERRFFNWNPFVFGGKHGGSITRVSDTGLINITRGGGLLPTVRFE